MEEDCCTFRPLDSAGCRPGFAPTLVGSLADPCWGILTSGCQQVEQSLQAVGSYNHRSILDTVGAAAAAVAFREGWRAEAVVAAFCRNLQEN